MTRNATRNKKTLKNQGFLLPATGIEPVSNDFWKWLKYSIRPQTRINTIFFVLYRIKYVAQKAYLM